jgi:hypothetical protein
MKYDLQNLAVWLKPELFTVYEKIKILADYEFWSDLDYYALVEPISYKEVLEKIVASDADIKYIYENFAIASFANIEKNFIIGLCDEKRIKKIMPELWYYLIWITKHHNFQQYAYEDKLLHHAFTFDGFWNAAQKKAIALLK